MQRRLTLGWLNCPELGPCELVGTAAEAGFDSVGIRISGRRLGDPYADVIGNEREIARITRRLRETGLRLSNVSAYHLYPDVTAPTLAPLLDTTAALGAEIVVVACYDADRARFRDTMVAYADMAAARRLRLALEFVPFSEARTVHDAIAIVDAVNRANFGLLIDPLHLARSGGQPADLRAIAPRHFVFAQLCDAPRRRPGGVELAAEARGMRLDPGTGELPLREFVQALPPDVELECEAPTLANLALPPLERARSIRRAALGFLAGQADGGDTSGASP